MLGLDDIGRILNACKGQGFEERRDTAIIRLLLDTGLRRAELAKLTLEDIDRDETAPLLWVREKVGESEVYPSGGRPPATWTCTCASAPVIETARAPPFGSAKQVQ